MLSITQQFDKFDELQLIEKKALKTYQKVGYPSEAWGLTDVQNFARHHANGLLWVALFDSQPIGFAVADIFRDILHLEELDVLPEFQGRGVGKLLLKDVLLAAQIRKMTWVYLRTFSTTPWSVGLYEKFGFAKTDHTPCYLTEHLKNEVAIGLPIGDRCTMRVAIEYLMLRA